MFKKNNKGFTLVELIVVLVILGILAAVLVPSLLGFVDKSKGQQELVNAKSIMTAAQAGIVEAYAKEKESFVEKINKTKLSKELNGEKYDFVSHHLLNKYQGYASDSADTAAKKIIGESLLKYIDSEKSKKDKGQQYIFMETSNSKIDFDISILKENETAFVILYNQKGKILYMQYARNGYLVVYDGKGFTVTEGGTFKAVN